jgi:large subunit ribosomal protein L4
MKLPVRNAQGKEVRVLEVDDSVFGIVPNGAVLHQAYVAQRANQRAGTVKTKTRGEVQGSTRKIRIQKYTGRARQGSNRSPTRVGGGTVFGPRPRDFSQALPKKMRRLAIRSALSSKVADGELVVIDQLAFERPKTKQMLSILRNVGIQRSALIVTAEPDRSVLTSSRNLEKTKVLPAAYLNVVDMMNYRSLLMTEEAVRVAERLWGRKGDGAPTAEPEAARPRRRRATADAPQAPAEEEKAPARRPRTAKAANEEPPAPSERPRRQAGARKAPQPAAEAEAPKPRRRASRKKEEGEG